MGAEHQYVSGHHPSSSFLRKRKRRFKSRADKEKKEACSPAIRTLCLFKVFCCLSGNPVTQGRDPLRIQHSCKSYQRPFVRYLSKEPTTPNLFLFKKHAFGVWGSPQPQNMVLDRWRPGIQTLAELDSTSLGRWLPLAFSSPPPAPTSRPLSLRTPTNNGSSSSSIIPISYVLFSHFLAFNAPWFFRCSKCFTSHFTLFLSSLSDGSSCSLCHGFYIYTNFSLPKFPFANGYFLFECTFCFSSSFGDVQFCERVE